MPETSDLSGAHFHRAARDTANPPTLLGEQSSAQAWQTRGGDRQCKKRHRREIDCRPPVIPPKSGRGFPATSDNETYKWRHLIENSFGKLKENKRGAMRSCKTDQSFAAFISLAATFIQLR